MITILFNNCDTLTGQHPLSVHMQLQVNNVEQFHILMYNTMETINLSAVRDRGTFRGQTKSESIRRKLKEKCTKP